MRRFLEIFSSKHRKGKADGPAKPSEKKRAGPLPAAQPRARTDSRDARRLAEVMDARKRNRWQPPELEGPEFGGLIERRRTDIRGLMPERYEPVPQPEQKERGPSTLGTDPGHVNVPANAEDDSDTGSTGVFLSALDNSAITLADSGLFKIREEADEKPRHDGRFKPYGDD